MPTSPTTSRIRRAFGVAAVAAAVLAGCGSDDDSAADDVADAATDIADDVTGGGSSDSGGDGGLSQVPGAGTIDACSYFSAEDFEALTGVPVTADGDVTLPEAREVSLGACTWQAESIVPTIGVTFHDSSGWEDLINTIESTEVEAAGGTAREGDMGLFFQPDGESWYVQVLAMPAEGAIGDQSTELALEVVEVVLANS